MRILLDGSNILYWRGGQVQAELPALVVQALRARRFDPVVYFDNTVTHHLAAERLAGLRGQAAVHIAPQGTAADELLLAACGAGRIQIVTNDRFVAWRGLYPALRRTWLVSGRALKGGRVSFSKTLRPAPL